MNTDIRKVVCVHSTRAYERNGGTAPLILNLSIRWRREVSLVPPPLYHTIKLRCPPPQIGLDLLEKRKNITAPPWIRTP